MKGSGWRLKALCYFQEIVGDEEYFSVSIFFFVNGRVNGGGLLAVTSVLFLWIFINKSVQKSV